MAITCSPYLNFDGNTREAMEFYQGIFGGELTIFTFGDFKLEGMPADGVMHAALKTDGFSLYASEAMPGASATWNGSRNYISFMGSEADLDTLTSWFNQLADGGHVGMALELQMWGDYYGQCTDKFGIEWMVDAPTADAVDAQSAG